MFELLDATRGLRERRETCTTWSTPANAAFLRTQHDIEVGLTYLAGKPFSDATPQSACALEKAISVDESPELEWSETFRPRLGVIVNARYLKKLLAAMTPTTPTKGSRADLARR